MLLREAVDLGDAYAMGILGVRLLEGDGVEKDAAEGEKLLRQAIDLGDANAMVFLGISLLEGDGVEKDVAEGEKLLRQGVDLGDADAIFYLATYTMPELGQSGNWEQADALISSLKGKDSVALQGIAEQIEEEGLEEDDHVLVGLLVRHKLLPDPEGLSVKERMDKARATGLDVPQWLNAPV
jgi:TPR repeat protein